ncbi:MAG: aldo/keto reductase [Fimbriimonadaceae bacterium]|nr:aldo/keto reductase [Fimbriimonadaceae bacterium]
MQTHELFPGGPIVSRMAYGCMRIAGTWNPEEIDAEKRANAHAALRAAYEAGYVLFDHADIYSQGGCETLHGELFAESPELRRQTTIATKCGIRFAGDPEPTSPHRYDFTKNHIIRSCEESLKRLQTEWIDIYQLHRPDYLMDPDEVGEAFEKLADAGKVRCFGVSNFPPDKVSALQRSLRHPLAVNQVEIHLGRLDCFEDGTLNQCLEKNILPLAWSPLGGGWLGEGGTPPEDKPHLVELVAEMDKIAEREEVTRTEVALAWLMQHPAGIVPIVGSANPERIAQSAVAPDILITRDDWYRLLVLARGAGLP